MEGDKRIKKVLTVIRKSDCLACLLSVRFSVSFRFASLSFDFEKLLRIVIYNIYS
jgi:hypothetical protein